MQPPNIEADLSSRLIQRRTFTEPFRFVHGIGMLGLVLILSNLGYRAFQATFGADIRVAQTSPSGWILHGTGSLIVLLALLAMGALLIARSIRSKQGIAMTAYCAALTLATAFATASPIATSVIESVCTNECHAQFVRVIAEDESAFYRDGNDRGSRWATDNFIGANYAVGIALVIMVFLGEFEWPKRTVEKTEKPRTEPSTA